MDNSPPAPPETVRFDLWARLIWMPGSSMGEPPRGRQSNQGVTPPLPEDRPRGRRHNRRERAELKRRLAARPDLPPPRRVIRKPPVSRQAKFATLALLAVLLISIGAGRLDSEGESANPTPTVPVLAASAVVVHVAQASPTETSTPVPAATAEPTLTPTPDPAFANKVICLDPGHGGTDRGYARAADSAAPAMEEAAVNLAVALKARDYLRQLGFAVVMTRTTDADVNSAGTDVNGDGQTYASLIGTDPAKAKRARQLDELQARINVCNGAHADLLLSIHLNGFDDPSVHGYETWFSSARSFVASNKRIAQLVFDQLGVQMEAAGYNAHARRVNDDADANVIASGDVFDRYIITGPAEPGKIMPSAMPGTIVESLFISNDQDAAFAATDAGQNAIATALAEAVRLYFSGATG
jgi:N-acetylmuramoyl-L-alanine amidase